MSVLIVASSEPRVGRSLVAAATAYRLARAGKAVTLARLDGDESAAPDAAAFAAIVEVVSPGRPVAVGDVASLSGDVVLEAPAGSVKDVAAKLGALVLGVGTARSPEVDAPKDALAGSVLTKVPESMLASVSARSGVIAVLPEDRTLAAPSVADIAAALEARWLQEAVESGSIGRVMIGTIASDAATPYFGNRERTCVITRFDKTDVQLAALLTDIECLVLTGGGEPSPYLLDRTRGQEDVSVLLTPEGTVEAMRAIEGLYGQSRFDGAGKLARAVELLDAAGARLTS